MTVEIYRKMAEEIKERLGEIPSTAVVLGSGLSEVTEALEDCKRLPYSEIAGFMRTTNQNHKGVLFCGDFDGTRALFLSGRTHYYEGYSMEEAAAYVRVLRLLGTENLILTNAAGSVNPMMCPGSLMLIEDHIKLTVHSPLRGPHMPEFGERFPDMGDCYHAVYRELAQRTAARLGIPLHTGVYFYFSGPQYETPAEIRAARILGADAVGMSTVPEAITAHSAGMKVLGVSCITNMAAGLSGESLSDAEVVKEAKKASEKFCRLLSGVLQEIEKRKVG